MKIVLPAKLAAVAAAATLASAGLVSVSAARASSPSARHDTMSVSITASPLFSQRMRVANPAAADCKPELQAFNRFQLCYEESIRVRLLRNGHQVGHAIFIVTHSIQLSPRSRDFTEHVIIGRVKKTTNAGGIHVALGLRCHSPCVATENTFPVGKTLRSGLHGGLAYHDAVTAGHVHKDHSDYEWLFVKRGFHPRGITTHTVIDYRCDDAISHRPAGCVFPEFPPVLTSMKKLPAIAANIRRIQNRGPGHYGRIDSKHPLHHITDVREQRRKRRQACSRQVTGPPPKGKSCDEYPFASTAEGGTALPKDDHGFAFVPVAEQNSQSGLITAFYNADRVLDGDAFRVSV